MYLKSNIENHLRSSKQRKGKETLKQKVLNEISIAKSLEKIQQQSSSKRRDTASIATGISC